MLFEYQGPIAMFAIAVPGEDFLSDAEECQTLNQLNGRGRSSHRSSSRGGGRGTKKKSGKSNRSKHSKRSRAKSAGRNSSRRKGPGPLPLPAAPFRGKVGELQIFCCFITLVTVVCLTAASAFDTKVDATKTYGDSAEDKMKTMQHMQDLKIPSMFPKVLEGEDSAIEGLKIVDGAKNAAGQNIGKPVNRNKDRVPMGSVLPQLCQTQMRADPFALPENNKTFNVRTGLASKALVDDGPTKTVKIYGDESVAVTIKPGSVQQRSVQFYNLHQTSRFHQSSFDAAYKRWLVNSSTMPPQLLQTPNAPKDKYNSQASWLVIASKADVAAKNAFLEAIDSDLMKAVRTVPEDKESPVLLVGKNEASDLGLLVLNDLEKDQHLAVAAIKLFLEKSPDNIVVLPVGGGLAPTGQTLTSYVKLSSVLPAAQPLHIWNFSSAAPSADDEYAKAFNDLRMEKKKNLNTGDNQIVKQEDDKNMVYDLDNKGFEDTLTDLQANPSPDQKEELERCHEKIPQTSPASIRNKVLDKTNSVVGKVVVYGKVAKGDDKDAKPAYHKDWDGAYKVDGWFNPDKKPASRQLFLSALRYTAGKEIVFIPTGNDDVDREIQWLLHLHAPDTSVKIHPNATTAAA